MTGLVTILRRVPIRTLLHSRIMLSNFGSCPNFRFLDEDGSSLTAFRNCGNIEPIRECCTLYSQAIIYYYPIASIVISSFDQALTGSFKRLFLGTMLLWSTSLKNSQAFSSCSAASLTAASTLPLDGAGDEWAESAGLGETLSNRFTLPVLELSASSSSSLDRTTAHKDGM